MRRWLLCAFILVPAFPVAAQAESETLEQAWSQVYQTNPSLLAERAKLRATDEEVSQALSHWRPSFDATVDYGKTWQRIPGQAAFGTANFSKITRGYGLQMKQPLFRGFRTVTEKRSAENHVLAERARLASIEQRAFLDSAKAFLDVLRDEAILDDQRNNEQVLEQKLEETKVRAKTGELTQTDVRQAETRLARAHVSRYQAETALVEDRANYKRLVGHMPEKLVSPTLALDQPKDLDAALHGAETANPDVIAAQYTAEAAKDDVSYSEGSLLPEINLVGNAGQNWGQGTAIPGREDSGQILVQATIPLYRDGEDYSRVRAAQQTATERRMDLRDARDKARDGVRNAWQSYLASTEAVTADHDEVKSARMALDGVREESRVGTRTTLDVLNAEQELLDAKIDLARMQHDRDYAILQIKADVGDLAAGDLKLLVSLYDPKLHYDDVRSKWIGFSRDDDRYAVKPIKQATTEQ